jgi:glycine oxidase
LSSTTACRRGFPPAPRWPQILTEAPETNAPTVWATGWQGLVDLGQALGRKAGDGVKGQAISLRHALPPGAPQIYHDGLHIIPHADGTVGVGSTSQAIWTDQTPHHADTETLLCAARSALPCLSDAPVIEAWAGIRPRATSRSPLMGQWPGRPGHHVMNGGFKIGIGMAPKMAEVMADLVLDGRDTIPEGFRLGA